MKFHCSKVLLVLTPKKSELNQLRSDSFRSLQKTKMERPDSPQIFSARLRESHAEKVPKQQDPGNHPTSPKSRSRRSSWPSAPKSILKKVAQKSTETSEDIENNIEIESGLGSLDMQIRPLDGAARVEHDLINKQIENEPGSAGTLATVVSARTVRKRRIAGIFQHYYPEGGWGYVILFCAFMCQVLAHGLQFGFVILIPYAMRRFHAGKTQAGKKIF